MGSLWDEPSAWPRAAIRKRIYLRKSLVTKPIQDSFTFSLSANIPPLAVRWPLQPAPNSRAPAHQLANQAGLARARLCRGLVLGGRRKKTSRDLLAIQRRISVK